MIDVVLPAREPFDGAGLLEFFGPRTIPGVEEIADGMYRRSLRLPRGGGVAELSPAPGGMRTRLYLDDPRDEEAALERVAAMLDLDADAPAIAAALGADPLLGPHVARRPGLRVPGTVDPVELAARAVLGQQVSLRAAATLAARLTQAVGEPLRAPRGGVTHLFPAAGAITSAPDTALAMPASRRRALRAVASVSRLDRDSLLSLPGIGPWTASYVAMRALRDPDAFLPTDLGVKHALARLGHDGDPARIAERWRPWRAYAVMYLWAATAAPGAPRAPA